ncbi:hypothetical protein AB0N89_20635 [Amycolatopsis sp. NPDC089917]|uniref:hypothetical protein n=1 Tax=Amycolatopsis sp. NPDC089917 TaxID=3155187 RepID=UPI0034453391
MAKNHRVGSGTDRSGSEKSSDPTVTAALVTRRGAILGAVITAVVGLVGAVVVALINTGAQPAKATDDRGKPPASESTSQDSTNAPQQQSVPGEAVPQQVKLDANMGVDLDRPGAGPVSASGPNGDVDLHYSGHSLASNRSGLFDYAGTEQEAKAQCPKIISEERGRVVGPEVAKTGGQHCLRTSKGTFGWLSVNDVKIDDFSGYVVINYQLFH